ncbi:MAG: DNA polymerase III subunit delta [Anaerolineae bacterium]
MFYILHGDDDFGRDEELARLRNRMAGDDPAMADLNTVILDSQKLTLGELRHACDSIPFMADRRLVIVHGLLARLVPSGRKKDEPAWKRDWLQELSDYLPLLPPTTRLVFVENKALKPAHPILRVAEEERRRKRGFVRLFELPQERNLPGWIHKQARAKGANLSTEATRLLAVLVGTDLRLLDQEIDKLQLYAGERQITTEDVRALVSRARQESIFDLVDCVGRRETGRALRLLHRMLDDGEAALYLLAMLARQIRILIQVKDLQGRGLGKSEIASLLKLHPYVVEKGMAQAWNFGVPQLEAAHHKLVETDWAIKTGRLDDMTALDLLVVDLTHI